MRWQVTFDPGNDSAAQYRALMVTQLPDAGCPAEAVDDLGLIQAELVGNAIATPEPSTLTVTTNRDVLRIEVFDRDTRPPRVGEHRP